EPPPSAEIRGQSPRDRMRSVIADLATSTCGLEPQAAPCVSLGETARSHRIQRPLAVQEGSRPELQRDRPPQWQSGGTAVAHTTKLRLRRVRIDETPLATPAVAEDIPRERSQRT